MTTNYTSWYIFCFRSGRYEDQGEKNSNVSGVMHFVNCNVEHESVFMMTCFDKEILIHFDFQVMER